VLANRSAATPGDWITLADAAACIAAKHSTAKEG
jgi:hypothetical protein